jgi:hypothetical protein
MISRAQRTRWLASAFQQLKRKLTRFLWKRAFQPYKAMVALDTANVLYVWTENLFYRIQEIICGMPVDRNQALNYLKDLLKNCNNMSPEAIAFENTTVGCNGYYVRIKGAIPEVDKNTVREVAKKHNLIVKEEKSEVLIFAPK